MIDPIYIHTEDGPAGPYDFEQINLWVADRELELTAPSSHSPDGPWLPLHELYEPGQETNIEQLKHERADARFRRTVPWVLLASTLGVGALMWVIVTTGTDWFTRLGGMIMAVAMIIVGLYVYLLPSHIAYQRKHLHLVPLLLLNVFLGWTFLGWVGALIWSCMGIKLPDHMRTSRQA